MTCHLLAVRFWCLLYRKIHRGVWFCIFVGMSLIILHITGYWTDNLWLSQCTALSNSALALFAVIATWRSLKARAQEQAYYEAQIARTSSAAEELAKILNAYKTEIAYYEQQAKKHAFSIFKERRVRL